MKTADLRGAALDYYVAKAEGAKCEDGRAVFPDGCYVCTKTTQRTYAPSMFWRDGGLLLDKYRIGFGIYELGERAYFACTGVNDVFGEGHGPDHLTAACRAVVRAVFGDEVEEAGDA